jgi:hypothetical protein
MEPADGAAPRLRAVDTPEEVPDEVAEITQPSDAEIAERVTSREVIAAIIEAAENEEAISSLGAGLREMVAAADVTAAALDQLWENEADRIRSHLEMQDIS